MRQRLLLQDAILAALAAGATVVTAGKRLARAVELVYAEAQVNAGLNAWERPRVLPWTAFLAQLLAAREPAAAADALPRLLTAVQAEALWEKRVRASATSGLLQPLAAARAAQEAWGLCQEYRLDPAAFADSGSHDAQQFSVWAAEFRADCRREHWLDQAELAEQLSAWIGAGQLTLSTHLVFAGFDECTPQQQHLLQALRQSGCRCEMLTAETPAPSLACRVSCVDDAQELRAAARWAAVQLQRNPAARIGIVVQDLAACREPLARALDESLCPAARLGKSVPRPYNLSLGRPLADTPVIHDALLLLNALLPLRPDFSVLSQLLRSPFMAGAESELSARARLELQLRETGAQLSLGRLLEMALRHNEVPRLAEVLKSVLEWKRRQPSRQAPSAWARGFAEVLRRFGWPGERTHDSAEHQAVEACRDLLGELAQLDAFNGLQEFNEAVSQLARLAARSIFQPASDDVPVQVMGLLEASGLRFDYLWIAGCSDDRWPASPRPNPLIPVAVQRRHGLPHASAQRELEFAQRLSARLLASAAEVIVSAPQRDADQELRPSPVIAGLPETKLEEIPQCNAPSSANYLRAVAPTLEMLDDSRGPVVTQQQVHGGTGVLKSQAACAFQAFAWHRLGAQPMNQPGPGLDARARGSLLHAVLSRVFAELPDHRAITALDDARQTALLGACVDAELNRARAEQPDVFMPQFMALERERLLQLLHEWLVVERARAPFAVEQREFARTVNIGRLQLHTRVDRLDRLAEHGVAIIDYKTGDAKTTAWQGERPDEPQLPCYAVSADEPVAALLFGVLRPGDIGYRGYARDADIAPGVPSFDAQKRPPDGCDSWPALLAHWRAVLTRLAEDYANGAAQVAPKDRNRTCRVCHLAALCRIDEIQALGEADDD